MIESCQEGKKDMDPNNTILVIKHNEKEVGRIAATASNASLYIEKLGRHHGSLTIDYVEDPQEAMIDQMIRNNN